VNSQADKERVRDANDIVEVVSGYVQLKSAGKNFKGLCPFHREKTPSFMVSQERQSFKCFGCGAGGDIFEFLMRIEGMTFPEALQRLAERAHVVLSNNQGSESLGIDRLRRQLYPVLTWAAERFQQALSSSEIGKRAKAYLKRRNVSESLLEQFGIGFAPPGWDNLLRAGIRDHYSREILEKAGLLITKAGTNKIYDRFRNRVMFPIFDLHGRPVAFGGRLLGNGEPKYLNSPETAIFHKGELLYGLNFARERACSQKRLILVEGYMDVIACHGAGVTETVASLGTSLTPYQAKLIKRYVNQVVLVYDMDEAGLRASIRAFELLNQVGIRVQVVIIPGAKDPDEYIQTKGAEAFQDQLSRTQSIVEFIVNAASQRYSQDTVDGKLAIIREVGPLILQFPKDSIERTEYIHWVAERLRLLDQQVITELDCLQKGGSLGRLASDAEVSQGDIIKSRRAVEEELIISTLLQFPVEIEVFREVIDPDMFTVPEYRQLIRKILEVEPVDPDNEGMWFPAFCKTIPPELSELAIRLQALDRGTREPERVLRDCFKRLQVEELQEKLTGIQIRIRESEKAGDMEVFKQLAQEKFALAARLKQFGVIWK